MQRANGESMNVYGKDQKMKHGMTRSLAVLVGGCSLMPLMCTAQVNISVVTGGSFQPGITRPGGITTAFCSRLTGLPPLTVAEGYPLPTVMHGVSVQVNGRSAPILAIISSGGTQQINFQVPTMPDMLRNTAYVSVTQNNQLVAVYFAAPWAGYPADFFVDGENFALIRRKSDGSPVSPAAPARRGEMLVAYATGMGVVEPPVEMGHAAPTDRPSPLIPYQTEQAPLLRFCVPESDCIGQNGSTVRARFAGLDPGSAGVYRIEFELPANTPTGTMEFSVSRINCYRPPCTLMSPFSEGWQSKPVKIPIQ